jgi:hypothetical protein
MSPPRRSPRSIVPAVGGTAALADSGRDEREPTVRARAVVVSGVDAQYSLEVAAAEDEQPVETLAADGSHKALGVGVSLRCADRRVDHLDPFAAEHLVVAGAEFAVAVVDQEPGPLEEAGEAQVARLLGDPGAGRVGCAAGQVDASASSSMKKST